MMRLALALLAQEKYDKGISTPGPEGKTPLEWAVANNLSEVVVELLKQGANVQRNEKEVVDIKPEDFQVYRS